MTSSPPGSERHGKVWHLGPLEEARIAEEQMHEIDPQGAIGLGS